jgi:hypothetical protein
MTNGAGKTPFVIRHFFHPVIALLRRAGFPMGEWR